MLHPTTPAKRLHELDQERYHLAVVNDADGDKRFGRYQVSERLGIGAMGAVYRARDESLGRDVAVKTIHTLGRSSFQLEMFQARFANEARAVAALSHPHVVNVFDLGVEDDTPYLVMELVEGPSLAHRLETQGPLSSDEARALGVQIAGALGAAHARGIVHRDVKPANILEAEPGVWKLADFGVAHVPDSSLTLAGQFLGSPAYAAPEALERGQFGPASDVYGLGATLYEAVSGAPPFGSGGLLTVGALAAESTARPLGELCPTLPPELAHAIMRAVERAPERRATADELVGALSGHPSAPPVPVLRAAVVPVSRSRHTWVAIALALGILLIGVGFGIGLSADDDAPPAPRAPSALPARDWSDPPSPEDRGPPGHVPAAARGHAGPRGKHAAKQWRKVDKKLREGKHDEARRHLREILRRDPGDERARQLYQQLSVGEERRQHDDD